jgi:hypothetical protein
MEAIGRGKFVLCKYTRNDETHIYVDHNVIRVWGTLHL